VVEGHIYVGSSRGVPLVTGLVVGGCAWRRLPLALLVLVLTLVLGVAWFWGCPGRSCGLAWEQW
jgi:hypothetical protein